LAMLKGLQRVRFFEVGSYLVATTEIGSMGSDVASLLADAAHVAFAADFKEKENETRVSARACKEFPFPLNEIMAKAAKSLGGAGGGHEKAAGCSVPGNKVKELLERCVETVRECAT